MISSLVGYEIDVTDRTTISIKPGQTILIRPTCPLSPLNPSDLRSGKTAFEEAFGAVADYFVQFLLDRLPAGDIQLEMTGLDCWGNHFCSAIHTALKAKGLPDRNVVLTSSSLMGRA